RRGRTARASRQEPCRRISLAQARERSFVVRAQRVLYLAFGRQLCRQELSLINDPVVLASCRAKRRAETRVCERALVRLGIAAERERRREQRQDEQDQSAGKAQPQAEGVRRQVPASHGASEPR